MRVTQSTFSFFSKWSRSALGAVLFFASSCSLINEVPADTPATWVIPVLASSANASTSPIPVTIVWSSAVTGFTADRIYISNGTIQNFAGSGASYTFDVIPGAEGSVEMLFPPGAGTYYTTPTAPMLITINYDQTGPDVVFSRKASQVEGTSTLPITFTATFSEEIDPSTFTAADVTQNGSATSVTWQVTDTGDHTAFDVSAVSILGVMGTLIPSVQAGRVADLAGNLNTASTSNGQKVTYLTGWTNTKLWVMADSDSISATNNSPLTTWNNLAPSANHLQEPTNPPTYFTNVKNGLPAIQFDGSDALSTAANSGITGNPDFTVFVVARINAVGASPYPVFVQFNEGAGNGLSAWFGLDSTTAKLYTGFYDGGKKSTNDVTAGWALYTYVRQSGSGTNDSQTGITQYWNGAAEGTANSLTGGAVNLTDGKILVGRSGQPATMNCDIGEIIVFNNSALIGASRTAIEAYLNTKWVLF